MTKGLKQMVSKALAQQSKPAPVQISGSARQVLATKMRQWSGWKDARVVFGDPSKYGSPYAMTDQVKREFTVNLDTLLLNPNRVLLTVTPFRLRQEAVMTGAMLHEAGHARHSRWMPRTAAEAMTNPLRHGSYLNGTCEPTEQCIALARLMEEARIEGLMARDANSIGAATLGWTMRATAAHIVPMTTLAADPNQQIMDLIDSWTKRAGREYALETWTDHKLRGWVQEFTTLLNSALVAHLEARVEAGALNCDPHADARAIVRILIEMTGSDDDTGPTMIDKARSVLLLLFPETPGETDDQAAQPNAGCASGAGQPEDDAESESGEQGEGDEEGQDGEGDTEPDDPGEGTDPGEGDAGEDEADPEDGEGSEPAEDEAGEPDSGEGDSGTGEQDEADTDETGTDTSSALADALADMEAKADGEAQTDAEEEAEGAEEEAKQQGTLNAPGGKGVSGMGGRGNWREPTAEDRAAQKAAEQFLRGLVDPSTTSKVTVTDSPSSNVDPGKMAAWKAGGQRNDPNFFVRTRRTVEPSPPVEIAILVDVSLSMSELQKPSALLSWELSAAALDLRNFAGRGAQVRSCLIHWGDEARVMQGVGEVLPGIRHHQCNEGTSAMDKACALVEEQMPGFFDIPEQPVNRLLVQFTDWQLYKGTADAGVQPWINRAMAAGVNMLTVTPHNWTSRNSALAPIMSECHEQRGKSMLIRYNRAKPTEVWTKAAEMLS